MVKIGTSRSGLNNSTRQGLRAGRSTVMMSHDEITTSNQGFKEASFGIPATSKNRVQLSKNGLLRRFLRSHCAAAKRHPETKMYTLEVRCCKLVQLVTGS